MQTTTTTTKSLARSHRICTAVVAFIYNNLLVQGCGITHHGDTVTENEEVTPSVENFIVLTWLRLIHQDLPHLVKQRYGTELRSCTLAYIKPEISQSLPSLIDELRTCEDTRVMRTAADRYQSVQSPLKTLTHSPKPKSASHVCPLCKQSKRPKTDHFLSACPFLLEQDRQYILRARIVTGVDDLALSESSVEEEIRDPGYDIPYTTGPSEPATVCRVMIKESPHLNMFHSHIPIQVTLDSGAMGNLISSHAAKHIGAHIQPTFQGAHQAEVTRSCRGDSLNSYYGS